MNIIKSTIIAGAILFGSITAYAQPQGGPANRKKRIEAQKVSFITTELQLTPEEAQVFWPVYNQSQDELRILRQKQQELRGPKPKEGEGNKALDNISDEELALKLKQMMEHEQAVLDLKKKYLEKYKAVLPMQKVAKFYRAEKKFRRKLMSDIRGNGQRSGQMPDRRRSR